MGSAVMASAGTKSATTQKRRTAAAEPAAKSLPTSLTPRMKMGMLSTRTTRPSFQPKRAWSRSPAPVTPPLRRWLGWMRQTTETA